MPNIRFFKKLNKIILHQVADKVEECLRTSGACVAVGGDHSMAIGTILGHARVQPEVAVLWIDAHADINTPLTSESGNIHGMPLSFLVKELASDVPPLEGWEDIKPWCGHFLFKFKATSGSGGDRNVVKTC